MSKDFINKVAIVTGGSSGIGRATAIAFAKEGAKVVVADIAEGHETVKLVQDVGGEAIFVRCDVARTADVKSLIQKTAETFGRLDFCFNNAGTEGMPALTHECTEESWDRTIDVNLKGIWACMKYEIAYMLMHGGGVIVNCASIAGLVGFTNSPAYTASKHGVVGLTKAAALENARLGIRINAVCPGVIKTSMIERFTGNDEEIEHLFIEQEPMGRLGMPEEIANAVIWLCSGASSFVTGQAIAVDGGWVAR